MIWNVVIDDCNKKSIENYNVLKHEEKNIQRIKNETKTFDEFCEKLRESKHVAVVPGTAFGKGGEGFVRASYCYSTEHIIEALRRIKEFVKEIEK